MLAALLRIPRKNRRKVAKIWGKRGNIAQKIYRKTRDLDQYTLKMRVLDNARGEVLREGVTYSSNNINGEPWLITKSTNGTLRQIDIIKNNNVIFTGGLRNVIRGMKRQKLV